MISKPFGASFFVSCAVIRVSCAKAVDECILENYTVFGIIVF